MKAIANFAVFRKGSPRRQRTIAARRAVTLPVQIVVRATTSAKSVYGPNPRAMSAASATLNRSAVPTAEAGVTPSSATAAPTAADASATPVSAERGGMTIPFGVSVSESSITPSARGSDGPGTKVEEARMEIASPCLRGPLRDWHLYVLVVDLRRMGENEDAIDKEEQVRVGCPAGACATSPHAEQPVDLAIDIAQINRQRFPGPRKRSSGVRVDLGRIDAVDDAARRRDVEIDAQRRRSAVHERESDGPAEGSQERSREGAAEAAHHESALDATSP